jgi:hypothetical protein
LCYPKEFMDTDTNTTNATVAQMVEQGSRKATVAGSMPVGGSKLIKGESFNGRITGLHPVDEGSIPSLSTIQRAATPLT